MQAIVVLHGDDSYRFIMVEDNGVVSSYAPRLSGGDHMIMVTVRLKLQILHIGLYQILRPKFISAKIIEKSLFFTAGSRLEYLCAFSICTHPTWRRDREAVCIQLHRFRSRRTDRICVGKLGYLLPT